jgi:hypothetical protein
MLKKQWTMPSEKEWATVLANSTNAFVGHFIFSLYGLMHG